MTFEIHITPHFVVDTKYLLIMLIYLNQAACQQY